MEGMYIEELKSSVNLLMANLESMPVSKGGEFKLQKLRRGHNTSIMDMGQEDENQLSKSDVVLSFTLEVRQPCGISVGGVVFSGRVWVQFEGRPVLADPAFRPQAFLTHMLFWSKRRLNE